jgi:hypothetical protein
MSATETLSENTLSNQSATLPAQDTLEQQALLKAFLATSQHFFGGFTALFQEITDPRVPELITYPLAALGFATILMYVCHLGARRQITHLLRGNSWSAAKFQVLFGVAVSAWRYDRRLVQPLTTRGVANDRFHDGRNLNSEKSARALSVVRALLSYRH